MVHAGPDAPTAVRRPPIRQTEPTVEIVLLVLTAVVLIALAIWVGRKIHPKGSEYIEAGSDIESARAHSAAFRNTHGGI